MVRPVVTEKSDTAAKKGQYVFVVERNSNKIEIQKAIEEMFNVSVTRVNTAVMPGKAKSRSTRTGVLKGIKPGYKKAYVTLTDGETIDIFGQQEGE